jgi:hypothetical protein
MKRLALFCAGVVLFAACSKSDKTAEDPKVSPLVKLANRAIAADSAAFLTPLLEARGFRLVAIQHVPAQLSARRGTAAIYRSQDGARGGVVYMQRMSNAHDSITWHWYFADGAPDSIQFQEQNGDGLWDVRVFMAGGTTRDFVQGDSFTFMSDRDGRIATNGAASGTGAWMAFDGDTTTAWQSPTKDAHIDIPLPLGFEEGTLRVRVASGSRASKLKVFAGDKMVQDVGLQNTSEFQEIALDASLKDAPAMRVVVEGPAATVAISELEIR